MHFAIDIDQTICGSNAHEIYAHFHNHDLHLGIDTQSIAQITSYADFVRLPQVYSFYQKHREEWNASRHRAIATPSVIEAFTPISGAVEGCRSLLRYGTLAYYTARTPAVREATKRWLDRYAFPESQNVICCSGIEQKVHILAQHEPQDEPITLIDDRGHTHFLPILERMKEESMALVRRLCILAFGASSTQLPQTSLCPLFALSAWDQLHQVLTLVQV